MFRHGVELLVETARMWADLGFFSHRHGGDFVIHKVTGPDEYSTVVDNNLYTNVMAAHNLRAAADWVDRLQADSALDFRQLVERTRLGPDEPATWRRAAEQHVHPLRPDRQASTFKTTTSSTRHRGTSRARQPTGIRCCCTTIRWSSTDIR